MGLSSALYTAVSGLSSNSTALSVTGNNIANSNTTGYKTSSSVFSTLLAESIVSSSGSSQVGRGSQVQTVSTNFEQGAFEETGNELDVAVDGDGFFIVSADGSAVNYYTRNGAFEIDNEGYLITSDGYRVQGSLYDEDGNLTEGLLEDIYININSQMEARATENVELSSNLSESSEVLEEVVAAGGFDIDNPEETANYTSTSVIYDSLGTSHDVTTYYTLTDEAANTWTYTVCVDGTEITGANSLGTSADGTLAVVASGTIVFDEDGNVDTITPDAGNAGDDVLTVALDWTNGSDVNQVIDFTIDCTQYDSDSAVYSQDVDGYASGAVSDLTIDDDGNIYVTYTNGETVAAAMIALATFANVNGLEQEGSSLWGETAESGVASIGYPGETQGVLVSGSLESSTVDLSAEFVDLITIQNGYTANSRVITTTDDMMEELLNIVR